ncbi:MAG: hemerythrin domain-containing protein, partial [Nitrososphaerota archaeon]|nr:hemerythrin domain-containing protein [Nitrososphaerota archaeon]
MEALVRVLIGEHKAMSEGFRRAKVAADKRDFGAVIRELKELEPVFRQHIADEESQILRLLTQELGVKGAEDEIRVFQQHRPIHRLMQAVAELAAKSPAELETEQ